MKEIHMQFLCDPLTREALVLEQAEFSGNESEGWRSLVT